MTVGWGGRSNGSGAETGIYGAGLKADLKARPPKQQGGAARRNSRSLAALGTTAGRGGRSNASGAEAGIHGAGPQPDLRTGAGPGAGPATRMHASRSAAQSRGPTRQGLGSRHDFVAVKLHPHTQPTVRSTDRLYMNYVPHTNPVSCGHVGDFLWHLKEELHAGASAQGQIRCKVHTPRGNIERLSPLFWRGRVQDGNTEPDSAVAAV